MPIKELVEEQATLRILPMPFDMDGICRDLKVPGKTPQVFVNSDRPERRQRFTLAHELGHIRIPWHMVTIADVTDYETSEHEAYDYFRMEGEANRFASEVLMPRGWVVELATSGGAPGTVHGQIAAECRVSKAAAAFALVQGAPPGWLYAWVADGVIQRSSRSQGTLTSVVMPGMRLGDVDFGRLATRTLVNDSSGLHVWWQVQELDALPERKRTETWRELQTDILARIALEPEAAKKLPSSINGIVASANSKLTGPDQRTPERIYAAMMRAMLTTEDRPGLTEFRAHPLYGEFMLARHADFVQSPASRKKKL